jgi:hypothetical protein
MNTKLGHNESAKLPQAAAALCARSSDLPRVGRTPAIGFYMDPEVGY